jgi:hypothetical protein
MSLSRHDYQQWRTLVPSKSWPAKEDTAPALLCTHKHIFTCTPHTGSLSPQINQQVAGWLVAAGLLRGCLPAAAAA